ncbi:hypothetical protein L211DRAFT_326323 [Terfezia boudieri ATCC MYA-4762]|uniref:Uncharacterized protein n=1 Tax=Terfezia boudieri ATCC MYA-4762 TaxID=1051890 RepID=A0A3N4LID0_9PEZI|nr:hypothetical protein L211DRAFT_326323 [Terfezia boudieri ATCC MYA-4762]
MGREEEGREGNNDLAQLCLTVLYCCCTSLGFSLTWPPSLFNPSCKVPASFSFL